MSDPILDPLNPEQRRAVTHGTGPLLILAVGLYPVRLGFALLAIEFVFRMRRLKRAEVGPRDDAVSAA